MDLKQRQKYFSNAKPSGAIFLIVFGCLLILVGLGDIEHYFLSILIGAAAAAFGIVSYRNTKMTISDSMIDSYCRQMADSYYQSSRRNLGAQGFQLLNSMSSQAYSFENQFRARLSRRGKDGYQRSSIYSVSCFLFDTNGILHYYKRDWSLISDEHFETEKRYQVSEIRLTATITTNQGRMLRVILPDQETIYLSEETGQTFLHYLTGAQAQTIQKRQ